MAQIDRGRRHQPEQCPAEAERDDAEHRDEEHSENHRHRQHDEIDQECKDTPGQHAAEPIRLHQRIECVRRNAAVIAPGIIAPAAAVIAVGHDQPPMKVPRRTWEQEARLPSPGEH